MSCIDCDKVGNDGAIAYYRVGKATVGLIGCDEHLNEIMRAIDGRIEDRVIYRINMKPNGTS